MDYNTKTNSWSRSINSFIIQRTQDPPPICAISKPFKLRKHDRRITAESAHSHEPTFRSPANSLKSYRPQLYSSTPRAPSIQLKSPKTNRLPGIETPMTSSKKLPPHNSTSLHFNTPKTATSKITPRTSVPNFSYAVKGLQELEETNNRLREHASSLSQSKFETASHMLQKSKSTMNTLRSQTLCSTRNTIDFIKYNKQILYNVPSDMQSPRKDYKWSVGIRASPFGRDDEMWYSDDMKLISRTLSTPKLGRLHVCKYEGNSALVIPHYPYCRSCREASTPLSINPN